MKECNWQQRALFAANSYREAVVSLLLLLAWWIELSCLSRVPAGLLVSEVRGDDRCTDPGCWPVSEG